MRPGWLKKVTKKNRIFPRRYKPPTLMWDGSGAAADDTLRDIQDRLSGEKTEPTNREK